MYCTIEQEPLLYLSLWAFDHKHRVVSLSLGLSLRFEMGEGGGTFQSPVYG